MRKPGTGRRGAFPPLLAGNAKRKSMEVFDYYNEIFTNPLKYHHEWSLYKIYDHIASGEIHIPSVRHVYIRADSKDNGMRTAIICGAGSSPWLGDPRRTERPAWLTKTQKILFFMVIPPDQGPLIHCIKKSLQGGRGPAHKIALGVQCALNYKFPFRISTAVFDKTSPFYMQDCVVELRKNAQLTTLLEQLLRDAQRVYSIISGTISDVSHACTG